MGLLRRRLARQRSIVAVIAVLGLLGAALAYDRGWLDASAQTAVYDTFIRSAPAQVGNQVTIVALDESTVEHYQVYPLPRRAYAELLARLTEYAPRVIAFDIGFYDPSPDLAQDAQLAQAIRAAGNVILAAQGKGEGLRSGGVERFERLSLPIPSLRDAAAGIGAVNVRPDEDGRVRSVQMAIEGPEGRYYSLPLVAAARYLAAAKISAGDERAILRSEGALVLPGALAPGGQRLPDRVIPVDGAGTMHVYYASPPATDLAPQIAGGQRCRIAGEFCVVAMADVIRGTVPRELLANRTILIGAHSIAAEPDNYPVPNSGRTKMWGVEIWANTTQSILTNRYPGFRQDFLPTMLQAAGTLALGVLLVVWLRLWGFLLSLGLLLLYGFAQLQLFVGAAGQRSGSGVLEVPSLGYLPPAAFWWVMVLGYILIEEQLALNRTQTTFGRFVAPSVARTIMEREESGHLALGGEEKRVTVLFGDIRGFTTMSEGMPPAVLLETLNRYFEGIVEIVQPYEGTVNKYNGDNIMVIWGAPLEVQDQARKAVECAISIQRFIVAERAKGGPEVSFGFGINTGPVIAGFLGAKGRMEYTVIGDTANVASRLTSSDIARRDQVVVSASTLAELGEDVTALSLGAIAVKGRAEPVPCYQIDRLGDLASPNPAPAPERPIGQAAVAGFH